MENKKVEQLDPKKKRIYIILLSILVIAFIASLISAVVVVVKNPYIKEISVAEAIGKFEKGEIYAVRFDGNSRVYFLYNKHKFLKLESFSNGKFASSKCTFNDSSEYQLIMNNAKKYLEPSEIKVEISKITKIT